MADTPARATRRLVLLFGGGALLVSLALGVAAHLFAPETASHRASAAPSLRPETAVASIAMVAPPQPSPPDAPDVPSAVATASSEVLADESALMAELRTAKKRDPKRALELAREGNRRFPNSPEAAERASIAIHALSALGSRSEARGEAEDMVNRYPDGEWVREVEQFTGAHRRRNVRLNAEGKLEFYDAPGAGGR